MRALAVVIAAAVAELAAPGSAQATWTVNSAGGAQFTTIQPAILTAAPGDRIEVQGAGPYAGFLVDRGVEVESLVGAICGTIEVVGVLAGQRARVSGFVVDQSGNGHASVRSCDGAVLLANVAYTGSNTVASAARPGLEVLDSPLVVVDHCDFRGHDAPTGGAPGVVVIASRVTVVAGAALGGTSGYGVAGMLVDGDVMMRGTVLRGGPSSPGLVGGNGGDALHVLAGVALVLGQSQLRGAAGSPGPLGNGSHGASAHGNVHCTVDTLLIGPTPGATSIPNRPIVTAPGGVLIGTTLQWSLNGAPGQPVWLGLDLACGYVPLPQFDSALVLTPAAALQSAVVLDALGNGTWSLAIPNNGALRHLNVFAQGAAFVNGALVLTAPTVTHTL